MNTNGRKERLREALSNKEYRDAFVAAQTTVGIPFQIRALREREPWTQQELATEAGMKQSWVSRIESPGYSGFSLRTLFKLASVFNVGLVVRFVPIGELVEWELNLSNDSLAIPKFEDDPFFQESTTQTDPNALVQPTPQPRAGVIPISRHLGFGLPSLLGHKITPGETIQEANTFSCLACAAGGNP